jgi:hypothetical protein
MKKLILIPIILFCSVCNALELKIYKCGITTLTKPGATTYVDLDIFDRTRTGYEVVNVFMYHRNADMTFSDTIILESVFITDMVKNDFPQEDGYKRIFFNMPLEYPYGSYLIGVSYCKDVVGQFWKYDAVGVSDEILETRKENATYLDLTGKPMTEPKGICIEVIGTQRRKVYLTGN